jgi:hypothetical protein
MVDAAQPVPPDLRAAAFFVEKCPQQRQKGLLAYFGVHETGFFTVQPSRSSCTCVML